MDFLPLFFHLKQRSVLVVGSGDKADRKIELLEKVGCRVSRSCERDEDCEREQVHMGWPFQEAHLDQVVLVVAATGDAQLDERVAQCAHARGLPVNVVNNAELSSFIFPSIIDRSPIIAAVSSSGKLPVLTRLLRNLIESTIPQSFGDLAKLGGELSAQVKGRFTNINERRRFWEKHLQGRFAELVYAGKEDEARRLLLESIEQDTFNQKGEVYLVGAGPGDPDLLTFKALRLMRQADIVLYDRLVSPKILGLVRADAEKVDVGKERANHMLPQQDINELLVTLAVQGKRVLRLKGGDPFIFGRGGEEIDRLSEAGVPFQVVPGITAASGCASYAGIPLTHREYSQSVRFITGHLKNDTCELPWKDFVQENQTLVFYMGLMGLPIICQQLIANGMSPDMPIALVSKGTTPEQNVLTGTLTTMPALLEQNKVPAPTLIIIGEVVSLRDKLKWM